MRNRPRTYTIDELEQDTGFDKRTISYYVQEGLLPRVGRRGRRTRYPQLFVDRLRFIKRLRQMEEAGVVPVPLTLAEIRRVFEDAPLETIADIAAGTESFDAVGVRTSTREDDSKRYASGPPPEAHRRFLVDEPEMSQAKTRKSMMMDAPEPMALFDGVFEAAEEPPLDEAVSYSKEPPAMARFRESAPAEPGSRLDKILGRLGEVIARGHRGAQRSERWTRTRIIPGLSLSARDLDEKDIGLLEEAALLLRRLIRRAGE
jgi:DNA-binding transcriptional MerR regulator